MVPSFDQMTVAAGATALAAMVLATFGLSRWRGVSGGSGSDDGLATRRERLGLVAQPQEMPASEECAAAAISIPAPAASVDGAERLDLDGGALAIERFLEIAALCGREDLDVKKILAQLADLLPRALPPAPLACRIDMMESLWWSSGYIPPVVEYRVPLKVGDTEVGAIIVGYTQATEAAALGPVRESFVRAAAVLVNGMLEKRSDQIQMNRLRKELERRQIILTQTQRFAKAGSWEYDSRTGAFRWSDEVRRMTGMDAPGKTGREAEKMVMQQLQAAAEAALGARKTLVREFTWALASGETRWLHVTGDAQDDESEPGRMLGIIRDVSEEKETLHRLVHTANHDVMTGLPNRRYFHERIEAALAERPASGALLMLDIDGFKSLNDTSGHDVGDMLLRDFARRLYEAAGSAFVARLGGDEFAVLMPGLDRIAAEYQARALLAALSGPVFVFGRSVTLHVSAGLALYPDDGRHVADLMKSADLALYEAKTRGRDLLVMYSPEFRDVADREQKVRAEVRAAIPQRQFIPFYQPKIRLNDGKIAGFEALLRWDHPSGIRSPGSILPAFEDPELSRALCNAMLDNIIMDVARWQTKGLPFGRVAFNASSSEFGEFNIADHLLPRLAAMGIKTSRIGMEVTETVFLNGAAEAIRNTLAQLRVAGIEIALDDFGTGFASLTHLQEFPVDIIKIDQSFVRGLVTDAGSRGITAAVLSLGRSLGKAVVAEGVETVEQARFLRAGGCDQVQGFLFARPMPAGDVPAFIENWRGTDEVANLEAAA
jgi:diguanylate cyclase (GGDEF)-like protein/PAS domain S-box-containing protein